MNKNKHMDGKGQIEMFGLAVIVVMLILGLVIYVSFKANTQKEDVQKEYTDDKAPSDFVLAILHVSVQGCPQFTVNDLIIDCARDHRLICAGKNSCQAVNDSINFMLNKTFMSRDKKFRFYSQNLPYTNDLGATLSWELFNISYRNCTVESTVQSRTGRAAISTYPAQTVFLSMNTCR